MPSFSDLPEGEGFLLVVQISKSAVPQAISLRRAGKIPTASRLLIGDTAGYKPALQRPFAPALVSKLEPAAPLRGSVERPVYV